MTDVVELVGGPRDGEVLAIPPGPDGLPMEHIRVAVVPPLMALFKHAQTYPVEPLIGAVVYRRTSISDRSHRWLYRPT